MTSFKHDEHGYLTEILFPTGYTVRRQLDNKGRIRGISDGYGMKKYYDYDESNKIKSIGTPSGKISFIYDKKGDLKQLLDRNGYSTSYGYDNEHHLKEVVDAEGGRTSYEYNLLGKLTQIQLPNDSYTTFECDSLGRLSKVKSGL